MKKWSHSSSHCYLWHEMQISVQIHASVILIPRKDLLEPTEWEGRWNPGPVLMLLRREIFLEHSGNRTIITRPSRP